MAFGWRFAGSSCLWIFMLSGLSLSPQSEGLTHDRIAEYLRRFSSNHKAGHSQRFADPAEECRHLNPGLDLALLADATQSVGRNNFKILKDFLKRIVSDVDISDDQTHVAVITYHENVTVLNTFADKISSDKDGLLEMIDNIAVKLGDRTFTDRALNAADEKLFSAAGGNREHVPDVLVLFHDGKTNKKSTPYGDIIPRLKDKGIQMVAVAIGRNITKEDLESLEEIAGEHVIKVKSVDKLFKNLKALEKMVCSIDGRYNEWSCWTECTQTCGGGKKSRTRTCTSPPPKGLGKQCDGKPSQSSVCNDFVCPAL